MRRKLGRIFKRVANGLGDRVRGEESKTAKWLRAGRPNPPPSAIKARNILVLADLFEIDTLVETGTNRGTMIAATLDRFKTIYSIEIDPGLAKAAQARFQANNGVHILLGDSAKTLPEIMPSLPDKVVFWLDGHYSGPGTGKGDVETPILAEIETIASQRRDCDDVTIIDDARLFGQDRDYPPLEDFLQVLKDRFGKQVLVADDSIFVLPIHHRH